MGESNPIPLGAGILLTLAAVAILLHLGWCWSGRSRGWARYHGSRVWILGFAPFVGLILLGTGLLGLLGETVGGVAAAVLIPAAFVLLVPGLIYLFREPRWWGPRWFRRLSPRERQPDIMDAQTALAVALATRPGFASRDQAARQAADFGDRFARWRANHIHDPDTLERAHGLAVRGGSRGVLTLYRGGLTFAANRWEDALRNEPTVLAIPAVQVRRTRTVPARAGADGVRRPGVRWRSLFPRLVVTTPDQEYLFEVMFASRAAARIAAVCGGQPPP